MLNLLIVTETLLLDVLTGCDHILWAEQVSCGGQGIRRETGAE